MKFNAAGDYFAVANNPSLQQIEQKQAFTIGAFININEYYKNYFPILDKYDGSGFGWGVEIFTDEATQNNTIEIYNAGSELQPDTRYPCAISLKLHRWYHIAVTFGEGEVRYYINGKRVIGSADTCANSASVKLKSTDDNLYIGYNPSGLKEWDNGMLDQVMLYDRVLTPREIRKLFNTSKKARK